MLDHLTLENFRGFEEHEIPLHPLTIIVGANNAGKSTVVEALRLVALVVERLRRGSMQFKRTPDWLEHPQAYWGIAPARWAARVEGHGPSTFHQYGDAPAALTAYFKEGASVTAFVGPNGEIHGVVHNKVGKPVASAIEAKHLDLPPLAVQPQVAPLLREERLWELETIMRGQGTYLTSQHFRNQLLRFSDSFPPFKEMAESSWPGLQIQTLIGDPHDVEQPLELHVRDGGFVGEVSLMGHGLQMWLQTVWFLARAPVDGTIVLDEPDVYMHPDLQRSLLKLVKGRFAQLLIATHSIEIMSDVDPKCILSIDRQASRSRFVTSLPGVQEVIDGLGGVHNIQLARLFRSRRFLLVEGEDIKLLQIFQSIAFPAAEPIDLVPNGQLGGRGGWINGLPAQVPTKNAAGDRIVSYAILDRDYFPDEEVSERQAEAKQRKVHLRVWRCKEIENYLLIPSLICRFIREHLTRDAPPDEKTIAEKIDQIIEYMRDTITDNIGDNINRRNRKGGFSASSKQARILVQKRWASRDERWAMAPGKEVVAALSSWAHATYGVSFGPEQLARAMLPAEVDPEIKETLQAIEAGRPFRAVS